MYSENMVSPDKILPPEIREKLDEEGFDKTRKHSRWNYMCAFFLPDTKTCSQSLTRRRVEKILEKHFDDLKFKNTRSTSNEALKELVNADLLEVDGESSEHRYWVTDSLNNADSQMSETTSGPSADTVQSTERDAPSPSTASTGSAGLTASHSTGDVARRPTLQIRGMLSLGALVAGLSLTIVALVLLRLPVVTALWLESAFLGWTLIWLGVAAGVVTVAQWVRSDLGTFFDIEST